MSSAHPNVVEWNHLVFFSSFSFILLVWHFILQDDFPSCHFRTMYLKTKFASFVVAPRVGLHGVGRSVHPTSRTRVSRTL